MCALPVVAATVVLGADADAKADAYVDAEVTAGATADATARADAEAIDTEADAFFKEEVYFTKQHLLP